MSGNSTCGCDGPEYPNIPVNPAGAPRVAYRSGDFNSIRRALLLPREEKALDLWRPGFQQDFGVLLVEFWAYLGDILTFYNEEYINEHYLTTAVREENVRRLIRILGYRPRPGIGARGTVAAIIKQSRPVTVPAGFPILSKPGPGESPQTFEVDADTVLTGPSSIDADPPGVAPSGSSILLAGEVSGIVPGEKLLLNAPGWAGQWVTVQSTSTRISPRGARNTQVTFTADIVGLPQNLSTARLLRPAQNAGFWPYSANVVASTSTAHLAGLAREARPGSPIVFDWGGSAAIASVSSNSEMVWYANASEAAHPETPPGAPAIPIGIPHALVSFTPAAGTDLNTVKTVARAWFDFRDAGRLIAVPAASTPAGAATLSAFGPAAFPAVALDQQVFVEDAHESGSLARLTAAQALPSRSLPLNGLASPLAAPLKALFHLLPVSRGKTVKKEVLGSGDVTVAGQEFTLKKSPLTYLQPLDPASAAPYQSTLRVWVDGIEWHEVASFFDQPANAEVFVTREDEEQKTHVMFGDGVLGSRLPSGVSNVTASYRYESGLDVPPPGTLTVLGQSLPGLASIRNPAEPFGGSDPDDPGALRKLAPRTVLTFDRAVSGADYEAIAAATPGVARARAYWSFDSARQRTAVTLYVGDNAGAVSSARLALAKAADPNKSLAILPAIAQPIRLSVTVAVDPNHQPESVVAAVRSALIDEDTGLFSINRTKIGQVLFRSSIYSTCLAVSGVTAVHSLIFRIEWFAGLFFQLAGPRFDTRTGSYFQLAPGNLTVISEAAA